MLFQPCTNKYFWFLLLFHYSPARYPGPPGILDVPPAIVPILVVVLQKLSGLDIIPKDLIGPDFLNKMRIKFSNANSRKVRQSNVFCVCVSYYLFLSCIGKTNFHPKEKRGQSVKEEGKKGSKSICCYGPQSCHPNTSS